MLAIHLQSRQIIFKIRCGNNKKTQNQLNLEAFLFVLRKIQIRITFLFQLKYLYPEVIFLFICPIKTHETLH